MTDLDKLSGSALRGRSAKVLRDSSGHGLAVGTLVTVLNVTTMSGDTVVSIRGPHGKTYADLKELSISDSVPSRRKAAPKRRKPATRRKAAPKRRKPATRRKAAPKRRKAPARRKAAPKRRKPATRRKAAPKRRKPVTRRKAAPKRRKTTKTRRTAVNGRSPRTAKKVSKKEFLARMAAGRRKAARARGFKSPLSRMAAARRRAV